MCEINVFLIRAGGTKGGIKGETLDDEENSDEGDDEDYTVYECHGLAPVSCLQNVCTQCQEKYCDGSGPVVASNSITGSFCANSEQQTVISSIRKLKDLFLFINQ